MMPDVTILLAFAAASALLGITPGPDIIYVLTRGAAQGPKAGVYAAAGLATGCIGHTLLCVVGLSAIIAASATAFMVIKLAGAAYLIFLGVRMLLGAKKIDLTSDSEAPPLGAIYRQSVTMNLLNPKVALFFLAFLPQFLDPNGGPAALQFAILGVIFMVVSFFVMAAAGFAGGQVRRALVRSQRAGQWVQRVSGTVLIGLGLRLALQPSSA